MAIVEHFPTHRHARTARNSAYMTNKSYLPFDVKYLIKEDRNLIDFLNMGSVLFLNFFFFKRSTNEKKLWNIHKIVYMHYILNCSKVLIIHRIMFHNDAPYKHKIFGCPSECMLKIVVCVSELDKIIQWNTFLWQFIIFIDLSSKIGKRYRTYRSTWWNKKESSCYVF